MSKSWTPLKVLTIVICGFFFSAGIMSMDYGATFKDVGYGQSLVFRHIEARVVYHIGLVMCVGAFLIVTAISLDELLKR